MGWGTECLRARSWRQMKPEVPFSRLCASRHRNEERLGEVAPICLSLFHAETCERDLFVRALITAFIEATGSIAAEFDQGRVGRGAGMEHDDVAPCFSVVGTGTDRELNASFGCGI